MGRRLDTARAASEILSILGSLVSLHRSENGVSVPHFGGGVLVGFCYRKAKTEHIGGFRKNPVRYLVFVVCWTVFGVLGVRPLDTESVQSLSGGLSLGSFLYRLL